MRADVAAPFGTGSVLVLYAPDVAGV